MRRIFSRLVLSAALLVSTLAIVGALSTTAGAINFFPDTLCTGAQASSPVCSPDGRDNISGTDGIILRATNILALISGITAVIMILLGGFYFVTAGGDSGKVSSAYKTITWAVVGLIVIVLARSIVAFVVKRV